LLAHHLAIVWGRVEDHPGHLQLLTGDPAQLRRGDSEGRGVPGPAHGPWSPTRSGRARRRPPAQESRRAYPSTTAVECG